MLHMKILVVVLSFFLFGCSSFGRQVGPMWKLDQNGAADSKIGDVTLKQYPLSIRGDSIIVHRWQHVFGVDPDIKVSEYPKNYPNPFSPTTSIQIINLVPDTLTVTIPENETIPASTLYHGFIDRGIIDIRIKLDDRYPSRRYFVDLSVGKERKRVKFISLR